MALNASSQDYLRALWKLSEWKKEPVSPSALGKALGLSPSTITQGVRKLAGLGLVSHERYGAISLTDEGRAEAARMVRIHRILETGLVQLLGYSWDEVHDEAERLEHAVSDLFIERLDERLGYPARDPHGDTIPRDDVPGSLLTLMDMREGEEATIQRILDHESVLHDADRLGLRPGIALRLHEKSEAFLTVHHPHMKDTFTIPCAVASCIAVEIAGR